MKNVFETKVYYSDTDSYGVAWHGSYLRWMEMGRVALCKEFGYKMSDLEAQNIVLPVTKIDISYKSSAKFEDEIIVETTVKEFSRLTITFKQVIKNKQTETINSIADVQIVAVSKEGKLYRTLPECLIKFAKETMED